MKNKNWNLVFIVIGILNVAYSFISDEKSTNVFGISMNIWVYRVIWTLIAVSSTFSYLNKKREDGEIN